MFYPILQGIAWILWPFKDLDPMWMRISMVPWFLLLLYGVDRDWGFSQILALVFVLLTLFSPVVLMHTCSLTPDIPLVATYIAGLFWCLFVSRLEVGIIGWMFCFLSL